MTSTMTKPNGWTGGQMRVMAEADWLGADVASMLKQAAHAEDVKASLYEALRTLLTGIGLNDISDDDLRKKPCGLSDRVLKARAALSAAGGGV